MPRGTLLSSSRPRLGLTIGRENDYCNTIGITIGIISCLKHTKDFHKALVLMTSSVEISFDSHTTAVIDI